MTFSKIGRVLSALVATAALGLGMTACGGGTIGYMWVLGTYYNQISGFKIDQYTGNLTVIDHSPFSSNGSNPVSVVVKPGGRYIYVVNSGKTTLNAAGQPAIDPTTGLISPLSNTGSSIAQFAVGGDGVLTFQQTFQSQGVQPTWAAMDTSGNFLYVLDKYSHYYGRVVNGTTDLNGDITVFAVAPDTGKLTLITNTQILTSTNLPTLVFEVGTNPTMSKIGFGSCLFTISANTIYPYQINSSNGQLTIASTGPYQQFPANANLSSINTGSNSSSNFIFVTDYNNNTVSPLQSGGSSACTLSAVSGSTTTLPLSKPVMSLTSNNGTYLYVLNQTASSVISTGNSTITAYHINAQGQLQDNPDSTSNPYSVGSGPVCIVEDPSNQYLYISNGADSTITGKVFDPTRGFLSPLTRGSTFPVTMTPTCLAVSGNV